jgi:hypothetical protein
MLPDFLTRGNILKVTFTYPDSMYELEYGKHGNIVSGKRTNTPKVYNF